MSTYTFVIEFEDHVPKPSEIESEFNCTVETVMGGNRLMRLAEKLNTAIVNGLNEKSDYESTLTTKQARIDQLEEMLMECVLPDEPESENP